jgi:hypothetical protein
MTVATLMENTLDAAEGRDSGLEVNRKSGIVNRE